MDWFKKLSLKQQTIINSICIVLAMLFLIFGIAVSYIFIAFSLIFGIAGFVFSYTMEQEKKKNDNNAPLKNSNSEMNDVEKIIYENIARRNEIKERISNTEYIPPNGYYVSDWTTSTTKVRGCQHYVDEDDDINVGDECIVAHEPTEEYPELTNIYVDYEKIGALKQEMAEEWRTRFGEKYIFHGRVVEVDLEDMYPLIMIEIDKPILRKVK